METAHPGTALSAVHERRLRDIWRSAGWPCHDNIELDLLAAGLVSRHQDGAGRETLRPTDAGLQRLALKRARHQAALSTHEALVQRVALQQQRAGRVVWRGLSLRAPLQASAAATAPATAPENAPANAAANANATATETATATATAASAQPPAPLDAQRLAPPGGPLLADLLDGPAAAAGVQQPAAGAVQWAVAMPDVYAIRHTTVEAYVEPAAFEIKVSRADLLGDLRRPAKAAAYLALASQCWYVLQRGIASVDEIPPAFGVMWADDAGFEAARAAPVRPFKLPFAVWMALARATALPPLSDDGQQLI